MIKSKTLFTVVVTVVITDLITKEDNKILVLTIYNRWEILYLDNGVPARESVANNVSESKHLDLPLDII